MTSSLLLSGVLLSLGALSVVGALVGVAGWLTAKGRALTADIKRALAELEDD